MRTIRTLPGTAGFQSYGSQYERRIGKRTAMKLTRGYMPKMGGLVILPMGTDNTISLANISGQYFLRATYCTVEQWPEYFGIVSSLDKKPLLESYDFELTDTFNGELNYCWVKRFSCRAKSDRAAVRMASKHYGLQGALKRDYDGRWNIAGACMAMTLTDNH